MVNLQPIPGDFGQKAEYTLVRLIAYCREEQPFTLTQRKLMQAQEEHPKFRQNGSASKFDPKTFMF